MLKKLTCKYSRLGSGTAWIFWFLPVLCLLASCSSAPAGSFPNAPDAFEKTGEEQLGVRAVQYAGGNLILREWEDALVWDGSQEVYTTTPSMKQPESDLSHARHQYGRLPLLLEASRREQRQVIGILSWNRSSYLLERDAENQFWVTITCDFQPEEKELIPNKGEPISYDAFMEGILRFCAEAELEDYGSTIGGYGILLE